MSIECSTLNACISNDNKTQRTDQSEFDFNNNSMPFNAVGNVNYNKENIDEYLLNNEDNKFILDTSSRESLKIKVNPVDGKKTVVHIIKRDDSQILEDKKLEVGVVVKDNNKISDDYEGDGKFNLYKHFLDKDKPFRRFINSVRKFYPQKSFDENYLFDIKNKSPDFVNQGESSFCSSGGEYQTSEKTVVKDTGKALFDACTKKNLYSTQSITNDPNFKILYDNSYAPSDFGDQQSESGNVEPAASLPNRVVQSMKNITGTAVGALQCLICDRAFGICRSANINPLSICRISSPNDHNGMGNMDVCPTCRTDMDIPNNLIPPLSSRHEHLGPNIYRRCISGSNRYSKSSSGISNNNYKYDDGFASFFDSSIEHSILQTFRSALEFRPIPIINWFFPAACLYLDSCQRKVRSCFNKPNLNLDLDSPYNNIVQSDSVFGPGSVSPSSIMSSSVPNTPHCAMDPVYESLNSQRSVVPPIDVPFPPVDPQLVKASLRQSSRRYSTRSFHDLIPMQLSKFDYSQHVSFDKIVKYSHVLLTIDNITNLENVNRVIIVSGNFVLCYKDLSLKGIRVPTISPGQNHIRLVFEASPPSTSGTRLLMHCGMAKLKKKFYYSNLAIDLSCPNDQFGIETLLYGGGDFQNENNSGQFTYKIRKYLHGFYYITLLPSLQSKYHYVSLYGDKIDEKISMVVNNLPAGMSCISINKQMNGPLDSYAINGTIFKVKLLEDVIIMNSKYRGKFVDYLKEPKQSTDMTPVSNSTNKLDLIELPLFTKLLKTIFTEWNNFTIPSNKVLFDKELVSKLKAHATALMEEFFIRLVEYLDGPILIPTYNDYLVPPLIYYNQNISKGISARGVFTYIWHFDSCKDYLGNVRIICTSPLPMIQPVCKIDPTQIPQVTLIELCDAYTTSDALKIVYNIIEREVNRVLSLNYGHNDFILGIKQEFINNKNLIL